MVASYDHGMWGIVFLVALGILVVDLLRRARLRRELEDAWRREDRTFLEELRRTR